jgi:hypothetical protein
MPGRTSIGTENEGEPTPFERQAGTSAEASCWNNSHWLERIMSYVLSLVVAATVLGATQASSEEVGLGVSVRWVDDGVTVGASLNGCYDADWNTAAIKEGESELPEMIAIIERNREDRERKVIIDR